MPEFKEIKLKLPNYLLEELNSYSGQNDEHRNAILLDAVKLYLRERKKEEVRNDLKRGYLKMAALNRQLADEGLSTDCYSFYCYEQRLVECEKIESKKR
ncbi:MULTISPECIES: CopG family transcriptional regulator [unclassified Halanaerobium]|uniref:CopG family transcriptional regulator n=1 Tax=unclassified Halanaerobium TaxID=2641197 RepID=UPI000DF1C4AB|nr:MULTISPECIES: CopG family transcriptional regulator [unclassified Halanaerobium]RCW49268.1 CopG family transcriptional regulator/antitoxin EndoAI [Halanaerobium sp. MA284_MarDTE_T2]RCW84007.1 CopG family transcriptional regulator/antitoxin EndoAI [Halanaerobium sp. DL-01]